MSRLVVGCIIFVICVAFTTDVTGVELTVRECQEVGSTCGMKRDNAAKPTTFIMRPCCDNLICGGLGPLEIKNNAGGAFGSSDLTSTGICTLSLDHNLANKDKQKYLDYVAGKGNSTA